MLTTGLNMKLIKISKVIELTTLSRSTIYELMAHGEFPIQVKLSVRSVAWVESEVLEWINGKVESRKL